MASMQRLEPLQNGEIGSKIKIAEEILKMTLQVHVIRVVCAKSGSRKQLIFEK